MDLRVILLLLAEAGLTVVLLHFSGLMKKPAQVFVCSALTVAAFALRFLCLEHATLDYVNFLARWVDYFRQNGGFAALSQSIGNYNVPYLYFLALFSYSGVNDLYLIKLLSILFDVLLAFFVMKLVGLYCNKPSRRITAFFLTLMLPTVVLNGAYWGQCDSMYAAFAVLSLYLALSDRPIGGMIAIAVSFSLKLQAVFVMPVFVLLLIGRRVKWWHFLFFPLAYVLMMLPAVLAGRPLGDTLMLYLDQMGSVGSGLNYNSSSVFAFIRVAEDSQALVSAAGTAAAFLFMLLVFLWFWRNRGHISDWALLAGALLLAVGIPFLLPHMHDRYFFVADVLSLVLALAAPEYLAAPILCQFASLLGYHAYLRARYLLTMDYGAAALIIVLLLVVFCVRAQFAPRNRGQRDA